MPESDTFSYLSLNQERPDFITQVSTEKPHGFKILVL